MVQFENKKTSLIKAVGVTLTYADLLSLSMKNVPSQGLTVGEMSNRLEVVRKFKEAKEGELIDLDDEWVPAIKECVLSMRWSVCEDDITAFGDYVASL